ncbi:flavin reductase family protein [Niabella drilacis]|uniref:NADH-FMN oxidoreductase RutF, flavin reductase (DIM6/NTAB) family n=1 Tax=Niabella drilacis (strain DSM 25811 / CCM 8410 / CCUG 62505 / LMG 26954 / E90) TaxID=1285928 RepID=A0A1G6WXU0_NIADE|nr:flavin reductase family protein [Niabella drilacis]SDD69876.1 NADH-FMN oxidoreductase RutF, flavin reductase (DIM6/NTAB) family [Niabella drilacis]
MTIDLATLTPIDKQHYLQHIIAPRPICFASTVDREGNVNLSPFSFFNLFSTNPPVVVFSPSRRVRDNTTKHTLQNVLELPEVVINMVDIEMVQQVSLASCEYPKGTNEFLKAGFTMEPATLVQPPMVKESKAKMECRVLEVKSLGTGGGAGNLVICEVLRLHLDAAILNDNNRVDQRKLQLVARLGGNWYCSTKHLFEIEKPNTQLGMGIDALPALIRNSKVLSGNDLGQLANVTELPSIAPGFADDQLGQLVTGLAGEERMLAIHRYAKTLLEGGRLHDAWQVLLTA